MTTQGPDLADDRTWLDAFRRGEKWALERVFRNYAPLVFVIIRGGVRSQDRFAPGITSSDEQDDLLQDVFVRVLAPGMRERYDGIHPYTKFLTAVARNLMLDHARKQGRLRRYTVDDADLDTFAIDAWQPGGQLPDALLIKQEETKLVQEFIRDLTTEETTFVRLRFEDGHSQRDVADNMRLGRQKVRTLEQKIRNRFQQFLEKNNFWGSR